VNTVTSEFGNEEDNVENFDVAVSDDIPEDSDPAEVTEVELLPQEEDGDLDDEDALDESIDEEDSDEADSEEESDDDSDGEFDDEDDEEFEDADDDAQFTQAAAATVAEPIKQTVVIETLPITGEPRVDDALSRLSDLEGLPVHEHGDVFEDVRRRLHGTLSDLSGQ
jgi:hypothetical protein